MKTYVAKKDAQTKRWVLIDARDQVLGRLATQIALLLMGKRNPRYSPHLPLGDGVVVINARELRVTGRKLKQKVYDAYSGYPGGRKEIVLEDLLARKPEAVLLQAVRGMLPKNRLGARMLTHLRIYAGREHGQAAQKPVPLTDDVWREIGKG